MWNLLKKGGEECRRVQDSLEEAVEKNSTAASVEELIAGLPAAARGHIDGCSVCREAALDLLATKQLFKDVPSVTEEARPWFAARVMAAIAERERELAERVNAWSEFPRFALRLALISAALLLAGTAWFYEKAVKAPSNLSNGAAQESIFETSPPANQDDVLISMAEGNP